MRKFLLLVSMALGLVAVALPASAMGSAMLTENSLPLNDKTISFEGKAKFNTLGTGIECNVTLKTTVTGATITPTEFNVTNPTTECVFFGATYQDCEFETHPVTDHIDLAKLTLTKGVGNEHPVHVTVPKGIETHPTVTAELQTKVGSVGKCKITTNDLTVVSDVTVPFAADLETTNGLVSGLKLTGEVRIDKNEPGMGTTTPIGAGQLNAVSGTLALEGNTPLTVS